MLFLPHDAHAETKQYLSQLYYWIVTAKFFDLWQII